MIAKATMMEESLFIITTKESERLYEMIACDAP